MSQISLSMTLISMRHLKVVQLEDEDQGVKGEDDDNDDDEE